MPPPTQRAGASPAQWGTPPPKTSHVQPSHYRGAHLPTQPTQKSACGQIYPAMTTGKKVLRFFGKFRSPPSAGRGMETGSAQIPSGFLSVNLCCIHRSIRPGEGARLEKSNLAGLLSPRRAARDSRNAES